MTAPTLPEFILARVAEWEASVEVPDWYCIDSARGEAWGTRGDTCYLCDGYMFEGTETTTEDAWAHHLDDAHERRRVLAQCAAHRSIVTMWNAEAYTNDEGDILGGQGPETHHEALCHLALIWADHEDYREEWKP